MKISRALVPGLLSLLLAAAGPAPAWAAEAHHLAGGELSGWWALPFAGMLLSIALGPLLIHHVWEPHFGKASFGWAAMFLIPCALAFGPSVAVYVAAETMLLEYMPFVILLLSLFTIAGGIRLAGSLVGTPRVNSLILLIGTLLASFMGTTGAAMLLIRPLLRANAHRRYRVHSVVFFIFLVANIGGSLTPLGDPPLFLGFLKGVPFFWPTVNLFVKALCMWVALLLIYYVWIPFFTIKRAGPDRRRRARWNGCGWKGASISFSWAEWWGWCS